MTSLSRLLSNVKTICIEAKHATLRRFALRRRDRAYLRVDGHGNVNELLIKTFSAGLPSNVEQIRTVAKHAILRRFALRRRGLAYLRVDGHGDVDELLIQERHPRLDPPRARRLVGTQAVVHVEGLDLAACLFVELLKGNENGAIKRNPRDERRLSTCCGASLACECLDLPAPFLKETESGSIREIWEKTNGIYQLSKT